MSTIRSYGGPGRAARKAKNQQQLVSQLAKKSCQSLTATKRAEIASQLQKYLKLKKMPDDPDDFLAALQGSEHRNAIEKAENSYLHSFKAALSLCEFLQSSAQVYEDFVPTLAAELGLKITPKSNFRIVAVRSVIDYGNERRLWSRDAQAIEWLQTRKKPVTSGRLVAWQKKNGGGPGSWSKALQRRSKNAAAKAGAKVSKLTSAARRLSALRKKVKEGGGAVMLIRKAQGKLYGPAYITLPKVNQKTLWPKLKAVVSKAKTSK